MDSHKNVDKKKRQKKDLNKCDLDIHTQKNNSYFSGPSSNPHTGCPVQCRHVCDDKDNGDDDNDDNHSVEENNYENDDDSKEEGGIT